MTSDTVKKYSKYDYRSLHGIAKRWCHKYIKLRDTDDNGNGHCIAKGTSLKYGTKNAQAGHFYAAGKYPRLEFYEDNIHLNSLGDNYYGHDFASYAANLKIKIGNERFEKLETMAAYDKRTTFKQDRFLMIEIIEKYKAKVKEIAKTKMFEVK